MLLVMIHYNHRTNIALRIVGGMAGFCVSMVAVPVVSGCKHASGLLTAVFVCNDSLHMQIACLKSQCRTECSEKLRVCLHTAGRRRFTSVTTFSHPHVCGVCGLL